MASIALAADDDANAGALVGCKNANVTSPAGHFDGLDSTAITSDFR